MEASIRIEFRSAKAAADAVKVLESEKLGRPRSSAKFRAEGQAVVMELQAGDLPALRASINTYLRLAAVIITGLEA